MRCGGAVLSCSCQRCWRPSSHWCSRCSPPRCSERPAEVLVDAGDRSITSEAAVASSSAVEDEVREIIGNEPDLLVDVVDDSEVLVFTATSSNAENAAIAANTHAAVFVAPRSDGAQVIEPATVPSDPFEPETVRNTLLAFFVGLLIGVVAALVVSRLDTTIRSARRLAAITGGSEPGGHSAGAAR